MSKPFDRLALLGTFIRIAETGSLSAAARDLGISQPSVSRQLVELESRLKTQLALRTTHSLTLTNAGNELLVQARNILDAWDVLEESHVDEEQELKGRLRIVAPVALGQSKLAELSFQFQVEHPNILIDWVLSDEPIRFSEAGCDCWIKVGPVPDDRLIVRQLGEVERLLVASPTLVSNSGDARLSIEKVSDLDLLSLSTFEGAKITLFHNSGEQETVAPPIRMQTNNIVALKEAAILGLGLAVLPTWFIHQELKDGSLVNVMPNWRAESLEVNVACAPARYQSKRLVAYLSHLSDNFKVIDGIKAY